MDELQLKLSLDRHQASLIYDLIQAEIVQQQRKMKHASEINRMKCRTRIIHLQEVRRQIPAFVTEQQT